MKTEAKSPAPPNAQAEAVILQFLPGWCTVQKGDIRRGGELLVEYDPARLPRCRLNWHGAEVWDIEACIKFHPGGQLYSGSVLEKIRKDGMVVQLVPRAYEVLVPSDATEVELWFRNFFDVSSACEAWDSRYGQNYRYEVVQG